MKQFYDFENCCAKRGKRKRKPVLRTIVNYGEAVELFLFAGLSPAKRKMVTLCPLWHWSNFRVF
jgi:hypothetical protein